ncbi:SGNH/GDSL hydrolase family protein [Gordonia polyisoprenivorans]|uniref:SGNH/GDSL hydrolase family protein n=1 Tax=Gordonia polyisoprenivorans TaxID=84595 RepID=UPI0003021F85|nr:SGNH/GDSL hydrolase family protein [Gordonia polyisoprenivorans]
MTSSGTHHTTRYLVTLLVILAGLVAACGAPESAGPASPPRGSPSPSAPPTKKYVALGSSYAAGPGGTRLTDKRCMRSADNYPSLVARRLGLTLTDASCSGAVVADVIDRAQPGRASRPQVDVLTPDTSLVTVTVGGNNIHYVGRVMAYSCQAVGPVVGVRPDHCNAKPSPPPGVREFAHLTDDLVRMLRVIHQRAPRASVLFVDYLPLVDGTQCDLLPLTTEQQAETDAVYRGLNAAITTASKRGDARVVAVSTAGRDHGVCSPVPWLLGYQGPAPYHETPAGKVAIADLVSESARGTT